MFVGVSKAAQGPSSAALVLAKIEPPPGVGFVATAWLVSCPCVSPGPGSVPVLLPSVLRPLVVPGRGSWAQGAGAGCSRGAGDGLPLTTRSQRALLSWARSLQPDETPSTRKEGRKKTKPD